MAVQQHLWGEVAAAVQPADSASPLHAAMVESAFTSVAYATEQAWGGLMHDLVQLYRGKISQLAADGQHAASTAPGQGGDCDGSASGSRGGGGEPALMQLACSRLRGLVVLCAGGPEARAAAEAQIVAVDPASAGVPMSKVGMRLTGCWLCLVLAALPPPIQVLRAGASTAGLPTKLRLCPPGVVAVPWQHRSSPDGSLPAAAADAEAACRCRAGRLCNAAGRRLCPPGGRSQRAPQRHRGCGAAGHRAAADGRGEAWLLGEEVPTRFLAAFLSHQVAAWPALWRCQPLSTSVMRRPGKHCPCCRGGCLWAPIAQYPSPSPSRVQGGLARLRTERVICWRRASLCARLQGQQIATAQLWTASARCLAWPAQRGMRRCYKRCKLLLAAGLCSSSTPTCGWMRKHCRSATPR